MMNENLILILQASVTPVVLISGIGLLLLSMTNRFGRVVDRARILAKEVRTLAADDQRAVRRQMAILWKRAKLLRVAIMASSVSILLVALIMLALFIKFATGISSDLLIVLLFVGSILALVVSMIVFLQDLTVSLKALLLEMKDSGHHPGNG